MSRCLRDATERRTRPRIDWLEVLGPAAQQALVRIVCGAVCTIL